MTLQVPQSSMLSPNNKLFSVKFLLILLLITSLAIRIFWITKAPPSMYWDEMDAGYQAYSILKTGKDYFGNYPSTVIHSYADFRAPVLIYLLIPFIAVLGLTTLAVKLPLVLMGTLSVYLIFLVTDKLFRNKGLALLAGMLTAFAPWNIQYSRIVYEAIPMLMFFLAGLLFFLKGLEKNKYFIISAIFFSLSMFTYNTMKLFTPLMLAALIIIYFKKLRINKLTLTAFMVIIITVSFGLYGSIFQKGGQRFNEISIFSDPYISVQINDLRHLSNLAYNNSDDVGQQARLLDQLLYNKPLFILDKIIQNYLKAFSLEFLFIKGDPIQRHSASNVGGFYRIEALTVMLGIIFLIFNFKKNSKAVLIIFSWILIAPIPSVLTRDGFNHATRLFMLFPVLTISSALGVYYLAQALSSSFKKPTLFLLLVLWLFSLTAYLNFYFGSYNHENAKSFQFRFNEASQVALENKNNYEYVIIDDSNDSALMNYLFVSAYNPEKFQLLNRTDSINFRLSENFNGYKLDNTIIMKPEIRKWDKAFLESKFEDNYLLIVTPQQMNEEDPEKLLQKLTDNQKLKDTIYYKSGSPAFYVIESLKPSLNESL